MTETYDVIVAGGGPAGSTVSTLLAQHGHRVLLLEAGAHPRFHIGESMLPKTEPVMQRLGIDWSLGNQKKEGAEFIDERTGQKLFFRLWGEHRTFQIERSGLDQQLFLNAIRHGVNAREREKVTDLECSAERVRVRSEQGEYHGRYFVDATGRSTLTGRRQRTIRKIENFSRFAVYGHYAVRPTEQVAEIFEHGNIKVIMVDIGWIWVIPLVNHRLSIGLVVNDPGRISLKQDALLRSYITASPLLSSLLAQAELLMPVRVEADFSYFNRQRYGQRYACCGDSAGFLDPVFSSGFFFAVKTAELLADRLHEALDLGNEADPALYADSNAFYDKGFQTMFLMIQRFYCSDLIGKLFFEAARDDDINRAVTALLGGDLWSPGNFFQNGLLRGRHKCSPLMLTNADPVL